MPRTNGKATPQELGNVMLSTQVDGDLNSRLTREAERHSVSKSWIVRRALMEFLPRLESDPKLLLKPTMEGESWLAAEG